MSTQDTQQNGSEETYTGTPEQVGTKLFLDALGPTLHDVMEKHGAQKCARVYAGVLAGYSGLMLEQFGTQAAIDILRGTADNIEKAVNAGDLASGGKH